jgi:hypothetical protein
MFSIDGKVCDFNTILSQEISLGFNCSMISDPAGRSQCEKYYNTNLTAISGGAEANGS